ncbi:MAG TPA: aminotransferase class IV, partial [Phnomibacter sp.]|nr:aminotransferase class IV [Phnomibacter sp.]
MWVCINGRYVTEAKGLVSVNNRSFRYGDGCFETMSAQNGIPLLPLLHMERLFKGLQTLQFEPTSYFTPAYLMQQVQELLQKNNHLQWARVRITIFRGNGGLFDAESHRPNWLIQSWPLDPEIKSLNENGLILHVYNQGFKAADTLANLKSNNYLLYALAALAAKKHKANDALVLNHYGRLADSTMANLWLQEDERTLVTPALAEGPVAGTMRRYLLEQLSIAGWQVLQTEVTVERMLASKAIFLTNAIYGLKWVQQVQGQMFTQGAA